LALSRASIQATMDNPMVNDERIHHVRYPDFISDPVGTIGDFYEHAGLTLNAAAESAMRDYLKNNRGDRYGKFHYSPDMIGVDINELNNEFASYRERYGLDVEIRSKQ
jgi:hypothetical protein